jgi:hypothetical protein
VLLNTSSLNLHFYLGKTYDELGDVTHSIEHYATALRLRRIDKHIFSEINHTFELNKTPKDALSFYLEQIAQGSHLEVQNSWLLRQIGRNLFKKGLLKTSSHLMIAADEESRQQGFEPTYVKSLLKYAKRHPELRTKIIPFLMECVRYIPGDLQHFENFIRACFSYSPNRHEAFNNLIEGAKINLKLTQEDIEEMRKRWNDRISRGCYESDGSQAQLAKYLISKTMKCDHYLKWNFAYFHAEKEITLNSELKSYDRGSNFYRTVPYFSYFLEKNVDLHNLGDKLECFSEYDENLLLAQYADKNSEKNMINRFIAETTAKISGLGRDQKHFFFGTWSYLNDLGHAAGCLIKKQKDDRYSFSIITSGDGLKNHQIKRIPLKDKYRPDYRIKNVSLDALCNPEFLFNLTKYFCKLSKIRSSEEIYHFVKKSLGGVVDDNPKLNSHTRMITPQRSSSCSFSIFGAMLRTLITFDNYKKMIFRMKVQSILHFYEFFKDKLNEDKVASALLKIAVDNHKRRTVKIKMLIGEDGFRLLLSPKETGEMEKVMAAIA